jgi:hypothetical protein
LEATVIISNRKFLDAKRSDKRKFLREELPKILDLPWVSGKRITYSRGFREVPVYEGSPYYALVFGDAAEEYRALRSETDKAQWIAARENIRIFAKGRVFLENELPSEQTDGQVGAFSPHL